MDFVDALFIKFICPIGTLYQSGGIEWIERNYPDEIKCLDENTNQAILDYRLKKLDTLGLTREFKDYNKSMMRWIMEFKIRHSQKHSVVTRQAANL